MPLTAMTDLWCVSLDPASRGDDLLKAHAPGDARRPPDWPEPEFLARGALPLHRAGDRFQPQVRSPACSTNANAMLADVPSSVSP
jgi:hypothetical protein